MTGKRYSREWILNHTYRYVKALSAAGLTEGDVVGVCSENTVDMACIVYATLFLGLTLNPLNFLYTAQELKHMTEITRPKIIFCAPIVEPVMVKSVAGSGSLIVVIGEEKSGTHKSTFELFTESEKYPVPPITKVNPEENVAGIFSSSGTTGSAKGVAVTQKAFLIDLMLTK